MDDCFTFFSLFDLFYFAERCEGKFFLAQKTGELKEESKVKLTDIDFFLFILFFVVCVCLLV